MAGIILERPFPTYPHGFPPELMARFERAIDRQTLGNYPASGTEIIKQLGEQHIQTGWPIVYTSADSVFQIAAHEDVIPVDDLYRMCRIARELLDGEHRVGRVIARPFAGQPGAFQRTERRHDCGITRALPGRNNREALKSTVAALHDSPAGLIFANLIDFDMLYGHRLDIEGYGRALEEVDSFLPTLLGELQPHDLLILTADHGCDPLGPSTDHSREYVPVLATGAAVRKAANLGTRATLADIGQTIAENFEVRITRGESFLDTLGR